MLARIRFVQKTVSEFHPAFHRNFSQKVSMDEETFYKYATFGEPQEWKPEEHTKRHADIENNDGM